MSLTISTAYYIRKLLRQNLDCLKFVVADGAGLKADPLGDLNAAIESLYLEPDEMSQVVEELEYLTRLHQALTPQGAQHRQELQQTETQIFWLLGFKRIVPPQRGSILLVDDTPDNLRLLSTTLSQQGYEVRSAISGVLALNALKTFQPDLILLDIMMPGLDGYAVCQDLKKMPNLRDIPVIFISAINEPLDKVKAFTIGGSDYITKPFQIEEVLARVEHQIQLRSLQKRLEDQNARMQADLQRHCQEETLYRNLFEQAAIGIFQSTPDGRYLRVNAALARLYGYASPDEMITTITDIAQQVYVCPQQRHKLMQQMQQAEIVTDFVSQVQHKAGHSFWIVEQVRQVESAPGEVLYYEGFVQVVPDGASEEDCDRPHSRSSIGLTRNK